MPFPAFFLLATALGAREGITNRREKKTALALEAERQDAINNIPGINPFVGGDTRENAVQLENFAQQFDNAIAMTRTNNPKLVDQGLKEMSAVRAAHRQFLAQNEVQARADDVRRQDHNIALAGAGKDRNLALLDKADATNKEIHADIRPYIDAKVGFDKVQNLLKQNNQLATLAGITAMIQSIDGSVVRPSELDNYQSTNGAVTRMLNILNKAEGKDWDAQTKTDILGAAAGMLNSEKIKAATLTEIWQDRVGARPEIDAKRAFAGVDTNLFTPIPVQPRIEREPPSAGDEFLTDEGTPGSAGGLVGDLLETVVDIGQEGSRSARAVNLQYHPQSDTFWEIDANGKRVEAKGLTELTKQRLRDKARSGVEVEPSARLRRQSGTIIR